MPATLQELARREEGIRRTEEGMRESVKPYLSNAQMKAFDALQAQERKTREGYDAGMRAMLEARAAAMPSAPGQPQK